MFGVSKGDKVEMEHMADSISLDNELRFILKETLANEEGG